ncbi:MAG: MBL fold metallo-hydrolase [Acidobacteriota bacterium]
MIRTTVHFLGTGDAFGTGGRLQSCALVECLDTRVLVDCGASGLVSLRRGGIDPNTIDAVLLTHLHGDHFAGVPFLLMDARYAGRRTSPLIVIGPPGVESRVRYLHEALFPGASRLPVRFDLRFVDIAPGAPAEAAGWRVSAHPVEHSSHTACHGLRLERDGAVLAFSGDTGWTDHVVDLARDADLFVCECYAWDAAPPGHLDYHTLMTHRADLSCRRLVVTHMGEEMLRRAPSLEVETAHDGMIVRL